MTTEYGAERNRKAWATRRAKYGASGCTRRGRATQRKLGRNLKQYWTPEFRAAKAAQAAELGKKNRRDACRKGHPYVPGSWYVTKTVIKGKTYAGRCCLVCDSARKRAREAKARGQTAPSLLLPESGTTLVPAGMTVARARTKKSWVARRLLYGESGISPETRAALVARNIARPRRTHCLRGGHLLTGSNVLIDSKGDRRCRACYERRTGRRPEWIEVAGARVSLAAHDGYVLATWARLRATTLAAHPDRGGTNRRFRLARTAEQTFLKTERTWYQAVGVSLPPLPTGVSVSRPRRQAA